MNQHGGRDNGVCGAGEHVTYKDCSRTEADGFRLSPSISEYITSLGPRFQRLPASRRPGDSLRDCHGMTLHVIGS